ncbi:saccharopine dehydrogenase NADP-binding domain-containing protein [Actinospica robiniae]|uniref:saccharopine dehydrogenase NADP-binding domain-containing protein n=1 Tax=Actinospica robiniae TaxID=304901 RepID=UPI00054E3282
MVDFARTVAVFGAYGHTGRFVVAELIDRGYVPLLVGRDESKLQQLASTYPQLITRTASADDPASLDQAFADAAAVINCAGPFASTGIPVIEAALRAGIPYVDVAAEIEANVDTFAQFAERARAADVAVVPAMAFFGGLGDLLATAAVSDDGWTSVDEVHVAYGLSSWHPTAGTQAAGTVSHQRRAGQRVRFTEGALTYYDAAGDLELQEWPFPVPTGPRKVLAEFTMADVVTIPSHLSVREVRNYMAVEAADDLAAPNAAAPTAVDERGRSAQTFVVDVVVRRGDQERRALASGQDIYAISAPLAVEAVHRILTGRTKISGVASAGEIFDAPDFLRSLAPHLVFERRD